MKASEEQLQEWGQRISGAWDPWDRAFVAAATAREMLETVSAPEPSAWKKCEEVEPPKNGREFLYRSRVGTVWILWYGNAMHDATGFYSQDGDLYSAELTDGEWCEVPA